MGILRLQGIAKQYSKSEEYAVKNISLAVNEGEILALVGASGSGKTTLLRLISGLEHPDSGAIVLAGKELVAKNRSVPANKRKVGMVFQDYALFPHLNILENVCFGIRESGREAEKLARESLDLVGITDNLRKYPHQLSGGQQQRVAFARAIAPNPAILLLDEPFSNLDAMLKDQVREEMRQIIKRTGITAIFVTHDTRDALSTADRVAILHKGQLQQVDTPRNLYERPVNSYVANFFGRRNQILATATEDGFYSSFGFIADERSRSFQNKVRILFRPEEIRFKKSLKQALIGTVLHSAYFGDHQMVKLSDESGKFIYVRASPSRHFVIGSSVFFTIRSFKAEDAY
ncbi:iron(III) transport system ATP-binding protein [Cyclobacterium lianum]|uniref:Iron(III) transport system ATP-binding protein n=1 Tax=Cyclobacterium lianum TaxID=388280 RepID=A0A1M7PT37_9BACT|nr:ABC transporter ATP-binding protein [Cyclobacterium lianum]SHN20640.1 iron(III) transport system ATP-binding protein [Cyclobacterium lianum]